MPLKSLEPHGYGIFKLSVKPQEKFKVESEKKENIESFLRKLSYSTILALFVDVLEIPGIYVYNAIESFLILQILILRFFQSSPEHAFETF